MKLAGIMAGAALLASALACAARTPAPEATAPAAATDSLSVAAGTVLGSYIKGSLDNLRRLGVEIDNAVFTDALGRVLQGRDTGFSQDRANQYIDSCVTAARRAAMPVDTLSVASQQQFLQQAAALEGAVTTPTGLVFIVEREGEGAMPTDSSTVRMMYTGRFYDGIEFDKTDTPIEFAVEGLAPGFAEGLKMMRPGGRYRLVIPASLGYGTEGIPGAIPGNAALDFTVDLIAVKN